MKKILLLAALPLLAGCSLFAPAPQDDTAALDALLDDAVTQQVELTEASFMQLSAELVCLRIRDPQATDAVLEAAALDVLDLYAVTEASFDAYQAELMADPTAAERVALGIVGEVQTRCQSNISPSAPTEI